MIRKASARLAGVNLIVAPSLTGKSYHDPSGARPPYRAWKCQPYPTQHRMVVAASAHSASHRPSVDTRAQIGLATMQLLKAYVSVGRPSATIRWMANLSDGETPGLSGVEGRL